MEGNQVIARFRAGQVTYALFENEAHVDGEPQRILKAALARRYRDRWGYWKSSFSFSKEEIPQAISVLRQAFEAMVDRRIQNEIERAIEQARTEPLLLDAKRPAA